MERKESKYSDTSGSSFESVSAHAPNESVPPFSLSRASIEEPEPDYLDLDPADNIVHTGVQRCFFKMGPRMTPYPEPQRERIENWNKSKTPYPVSQKPGEEDVNKSKRWGSLKKICKYLLWIMVFFGIAALISLATLNNKETRELSSLANKVPEMSYFKAQKEDINGIKSLLDILKVKILENAISKENSSFICVEDCRLSTNGDFQSCQTCYEYITCSNGILSNRTCPQGLNGQLVWDDIQKMCTYKSSTC